MCLSIGFSKNTFTKSTNRSKWRKNVQIYVSWSGKKILLHANGWFKSYCNVHTPELKNIKEYGTNIFANSRNESVCTWRTRMKWYVDIQASDGEPKMGCFFVVFAIYLSLFGKYSHQIQNFGGTSKKFLRNSCHLFWHSTDLSDVFI